VGNERGRGGNWFNHHPYHNACSDAWLCRTVPRTTHFQACLFLAFFQVECIPRLTVFRSSPTALSQVLREQHHWRFHSRGRLSMAACITSGSRTAHIGKQIFQKSLSRCSRTKALTGCKPVLRRMMILVTLSIHPMPSIFR